MFVLYFCLTYNVMDLTEISSLFYESKEFYLPEISVPHIEKEEEKKKEKDGESNILVKSSPRVISPKRQSFLNDNIHNSNKFPIILQGKVKLPIFISFDMTNENNLKGNHHC